MCWAMSLPGHTGPCGCRATVRVSPGATVVNCLNRHEMMSAGVCPPPWRLLWVTARIFERQLQGGEIGTADVGSGARPACRLSDFSALKPSPRVGRLRS